jgi:hypothetical protein
MLSNNFQEARRWNETFSPVFGRLTAQKWSRDGLDATVPLSLIYGGGSQIVHWPDGHRSSSGPLGAARAEAIAAQHGSSARRLERHSIGLTALVAGDLKTLAFASSSAAPAPRTSAKLRAARVTTFFAALRLAQVAFVVIFLFALRERECIPAIGACDVNVWHDLLSPSESEAGLMTSPSCSDRAPCARFFPAVP